MSDKSSLVSASESGLLMTFRLSTLMGLPLLMGHNLVHRNPRTNVSHHQLLGPPQSTTALVRDLSSAGPIKVHHSNSSDASSTSTICFPQQVGFLLPNSSQTPQLHQILLEQPSLMPIPASSSFHHVFLILTASTCPHSQCLWDVCACACPSNCLHVCASLHLSGLGPHAQGTVSPYQGKEHHGHVFHNPIGCTAFGMCSDAAWLLPMYLATPIYQEGSSSSSER